MNVLLVGINAKYIHSNLAIRYLKVYADEVASISIAEYTINQPIDLILHELVKREPKVLGFSCYIWNYDYVRKLCIELKKLLPRTVLVLGGPEVSFNPNEVLEQTGCDHVLCGEGEESFKVLLTEIKSGIVSPKIINCTKAVPLEDIPFIYHSYSELQNRIIYYEASRGCPFRCSYCLSGGNTVRIQQVERVHDDMQKFLNENIPQVKFIDRTFNAIPTFALSIWRYLAAHDNGVTNFHFEIAAELITDEMIAFLQTVRKGLFQFEIGVQSTNPPTLKAIRRSTKPQLLTKVVRGLQQNRNIHLHLDLIAGLPLEEYEQFAESFNFVYALQPDQLQLGFLKLLKGSSLHAQQEQYGLVHTDYPPYEVLKTDALTYSEVIKLKHIEEMVELFYNSNRYKSTLKLLSVLFATPFELFEALADHYVQHGHHLRPHSKVEYYDILLDFAPQVEHICEAIRFDIFSHEKANKLPGRINYSERALRVMRTFLSDSDNISKYLPEYAEFNCAQLARIVHLDIFPFNPLNGNPNDCTETVLLFNYRRCDLLGNAYIVELDIK